MSAPRRARRTLADRPFLFFGLLLLLPALGFGLLGWRSVQREGAVHRREVANEARDVVDRRLEEIARDLRLLAGREADRPYYAYQDEFAPEQTIFQQLDFQVSPLTGPTEDPRVLGYFQWELGAKGAFPRPEVFGPSPTGWADDLADVYGPVLRRRLEDAPLDLDPRSVRRVDHALRVVKANEERGQLIEEIQILRNVGQAAQGAPAGPPQAQTPYLETFDKRAIDESVPVRYGAFRYLARPHDRPGPPLVAWRIVWIPAAWAEQREVSRDRWLLQGYALDPGVGLPAPNAEAIGSVLLWRADVAPVGADATILQRGSLAGVMGADVLPDAEGRREADPRLELVALPRTSVLESAAADARARFLWLLAGVLTVVAVGLLVLTRSLRREVALARRKEDFLAAVTHELKTPLTGIRMHADMLREGWVDDADACRRHATRILDESDRLGHLVDQVLDLAALERGVALAHAVPGDLGATAREAASVFERRAAEQAVDFEVDVEPDLPLVPFDPRLVRPLVLNLLDNAFKYGAREDPKHVRLAVSRDGDGVRLVVSDRGPGIDPRVRRRLFEPFQRAGDELTRTAPGIGIGLALVKRYAQAHGATVAVQSEPGRGTTFTVRFGARAP